MYASIPHPFRSKIGYVPPIKGTKIVSFKVFHEMRTFANRYQPVSGFQRRALATANGQTMSNADLLESSLIADKYIFSADKSLSDLIVGRFGAITKVVLTYSEDTDTNGIEIQTANGKRIFARPFFGEGWTKGTSYPAQELNPANCVIGKCKSGDTAVNNIYVNVEKALA